METWDITSDTTIASEAYFVVKVVVYDLLGRSRSTHEAGYRPAGAHALEVNAGGLASGRYHLVLRAGGQTVGSRALVIVR